LYLNHGKGNLAFQLSLNCKNPGEILAVLKIMLWGGGTLKKNLSEHGKSATFRESFLLRWLFGDISLMTHVIGYKQEDDNVPAGKDVACFISATI
jgi:hypothetical protein